MSDIPYLVIFTDFGQGDCICSTVAIRNARKKYPKIPIIVASVYPDIYFNNPNITTLYRLGMLTDLYEKWIKPATSVDQVYNIKIYERPWQRLYTKPISHLMCEIMNVPFDNDTPELFLTESEEEFGSDFVNSYKKPVIIIQCESARPPLQGNKKMINEKDMVDDWWDKFAAIASEKYDIIQVGCSEEKLVKGLKTSLLGKTTIRQTFSIVKYCHSFVCIDSILGHIGPAVGKKGIVMFGRSRVKTLAHDSNINVIAEGSCEDLQCCRPEPQFGDLVVENNGLRNWFCKDRKCMKAIIPEDVVAKLDSIAK